MKTRIAIVLMIMLGLLSTPTLGMAADTNSCTLASACCYELETGWGAGTRYVPDGNWATYTPYDGAAKQVTLYAGKTMVAGKVIFSAPDLDGNVTITIRLNPGWRFFWHGADGTTTESVHIEDYMETPPAENPAPGLFTYKYIATGWLFSTQLPAANFYGIHVSLIHNVPCLPSTVIAPAPSIR